MLQEIKNVQDENGFWKLVNTKRKKKVRVAKDIKKEEWFKPMLDGQDLKYQIELDKEKWKKGIMERG